MQFSIVFTEQAEKEFLKLEKSARDLISRTILTRLQVDPIGYGKELKYTWGGHLSLRVSSYRIIYRVENQKCIVIIVRIARRADVYED